jgi:predicted Fe-Mo cluster-binding NifX family protein
MHERNSQKYEIKKGGCMKIALSIFKDSISTVFDSADQLLILDEDEATGKKRTIIKLSTADAAVRATQLKEKGVEVLICGAISRPLKSSISSAGIVVYPFVRGLLEDVIAAYQNGRITSEVFAMPGCRRRECAGRRRRNRSRQGGWQ